MNIILPEQFTRYDEKTGKKIVFIENGILYMRNDVSFKSLMRDLTYAIYGKKICQCCGNKIPSKKLSIDHIIPQDYGGPDITNNLVPYCKECNERKANLMPKQHSKYLKIEGQKEKSEFVKKCSDENEKVRYDKEFLHLCDGKELWVKQMRVSKIRGTKKEVHYPSEFGKNKHKQPKYRKTEIFYAKYQNFQKPIIVDRRKHLLGGYVAVNFAKNNSITEVPVIIIENMEVFY